MIMYTYMLHTCSCVNSSRSDVIPSDIGREGLREGHLLLQRQLPD